MQCFSWLLLFTGLWITLCSGLAYGNTLTCKRTYTDTVTGKLTVSTPKIKPVKPANRPDTIHNPMLALRRSAFIPGWGQIYNHKWWKAPVIYTGLGLLASAVIYNHRYYKQYLTVYEYYKNGQATVAVNAPHYILYKQLRAQTNNTQVVANYVNSFQRNMQLSILGLAGAWAIQMLDAYIDARFIRSYNMTPDLTLTISPGIINGIQSASTLPGLSFGPALSFRINR